MKKALLLILILFFQLNLFGQMSLVYPNDEHFQDSLSVFFQWNPVSNAVSYDIVIYDDPGLTSIHSTHTCFSTDTTLAIPFGDYYFQIFSSNGLNSASRSFHIVDINSMAPYLWMKSDTGLTTDINGFVSEWRDLGGNNFHGTQTTAGAQPQLNASSSEINGYPSLLFDGNDRLNTPNLGIQDAEIFFLGKGNVFIQNVFFGIGLGYRSNGPSSSGAMLYLAGDNYRAFYPQQTAGKFKYHNFGFLNGDAVTSSFVRINDNDLNPGGFQAQNTGFTLNNLNIGGGTLNGEMAEIFVFDRALTPNERTSISGYIRSKYAPPVNLGQDIAYSLCPQELRAGERFESYLWSDGSLADSLIVNESGTYWVEVTDVFGFTSSDTIEVVFPETNVPSTQLFCPGDSTTWYTGLGSDYNYLWSDGSTADSLTINSMGDYHVQITDTNGCSLQSDTLYFEADPFENIVDLGPDTNLCTGNKIMLSAGDSLAVDYLWSTGVTDSTIIINSTGTYYLDVVNNNGCSASDTIDVTIIGDAPKVIPFISEPICQNHVFLYQDQSTTTDGSSVISWDWDFGDGGSAMNEQGNYAYNSDGVMNISLTVETSAGCFNDSSVSVNVLGQPVLDFTTLNDCQEKQISFNGGQLTPTTINTWQWNFDDPASGINNEGSGQNTTHIFESSDDYAVELIGTDINGCSDTVVQTITIQPSPQVDFTFEEVCEGNPVNFENLSTIESPGTINMYNWSFGDGAFSGQIEPQKLYSNYGTYTVTLNATGNNGCTGQLSAPLKIHAFPLVDQNINASCAGISSELSDASFVPNGSIAEVYWSLNGDSPINAFSFDYIFENSGIQTINQTVVSSFGCSSNDSYTIQVNDFLQADFQIDPGAFLAGYPISFNNISVGATTNEWTFDNLGSSSDINPNFVFPESSVGDEVTVELKIENSFACRDSVSLTLPVLSTRTDLAISQLFLQEGDGFYIIGVELENKGTTPITSADLFLRTPSVDILKEIWEGELNAGDKEIYIFSASPSMTVPQENIDQNYVCVEGRIRTPFEFKDEDLSNNEVCKAISESYSILLVPHPNPIESELNIQLVLPFDEVGTLEVYNAQGQLVTIIREGEVFKKGLNSLKINTELWQSGNYSIVYNGEEEQRIVKVIKL